MSVFYCLIDLIDELNVLEGFENVKAEPLDYEGIDICTYWIALCDIVIRQYWIDPGRVCSNMWASSHSEVQ